MQLMVTMKERGAGIIGHKVHLDLLVGLDVDYVLHHTRRSPAADLYYLKAMPVKKKIFRMLSINA
jgi:hypothetical protein